MQLKAEYVAIIMSTKISLEETQRLRLLGYVIYRSDAAGRTVEMGKHVGTLQHIIRNVKDGMADYETHEIGKGRISIERVAIADIKA